ncbi:MAG: ABC transporter permease [Candidatus Aureabacteria bacterium]|mgnify:FL=1|jgi:ABC-type polysaccharide/polyol phosphate export permease|nr:ABC transporter permease [Candidatus Auribacterota bacterium]HOE26114.1 ABC transporter permease [bacterium]HQM53575.1 ABC transporter permease [bacterium]
MGLFTDIIGKREMLATLVARNLKIRYQGSTLGFLWTLLNPLFMMLVYWIFIRFLKFPMPLPDLLAGILAWQFLTMCCNDSISAVAGHPNLVKKIYFPRAILPLSTVLANLVNYLLSLFVLFVFALLAGRLAWGPRLALLPFVVALQLVFCLGLAFLVSCSSVYFRDTEHLVGVLLMAWFFMSPVIYSYEFIAENDLVPRWLLALYGLNPMAGLITLYRAVIVGGPWPGAPAAAAAVVVSLLVLAAGVRVFGRYAPDFADEL